ncbi:hypothetical protein HHK36_028196 [Tetracentron sinense]|uniref:RING-type E3 ubiquitin transferase n=1 Tax=Tetracentron sinense TaxID=13715 RepID=A0A834YEF2_TETSI|nr:hypothetical protein HHK36_028196 [Tetracentron sinense]
MDFADDDSGPNFSPLVIAVIGILASAFLLVSYYTFISKYCGNSDRARRRENNDPGEELDDNPLHNEPWEVGTGGLDEALIKSITVYKYNKRNGSIEGTDCSVCLNEFQEDESLRLLPKCKHAFHLPCIDTWLKSHSNCPLCRATIVPTNPLPIHLPPPIPESSPENRFRQENQPENSTVTMVENLESGCVEEVSLVSDVPKTPLRAISDLGNFEERHTIIQIRDEGTLDIRRSVSTLEMRRSVSMDSSQQGRLLIADVLHINQDDCQMEDRQFPMNVGSSKLPSGEHCKSSNRSRVLHCVMSPVAMKRSFSNGRLSFTRHGRGRNTIIPM